MNIIYMHTHDTGRYIQPYGYPVPTPNLMGLAREGALFRHAYCAGPTCSPSRAALLTGMAPHSCGMIGLAHRGFRLNDYSKHLAQFLNRNGYETVLCGVQHEAPYTDMIGYHKVLDDPKNNSLRDSIRYDTENAQRAVEYLKGKIGKPFFLSYGMFNTHREFPENDGAVDPDYVMPPYPVYDTSKNREDMAAFISSAMTADRCVGIVLSALNEAGLEDDTLVLYTTDHGIAFPHMKCNLYDTGIGISLILKYPGNKMKGEAIDALVSQVDIFPTLCDMLGLKKPEWLQGVSMMPILNGEAGCIRDEVFSEVTFHAAYEPMRCIRTERYKLVRFYGDNLGTVPANIDDCPGKDFLIESGYLDMRHNREMLFDLHLDPVERINLAHDARYLDIYRSLSSRLDDWMRQTKDPLLFGKVEKPEGTIVNKQGCLTPKSEDFE